MITEWTLKASWKHLQALGGFVLYDFNKTNGALSSHLEHKQFSLMVHQHGGSKGAFLALTEEILNFHLLSWSPGKTIALVMRGTWGCPELWFRWGSISLIPESLRKAPAPGGRHEQLVPSAAWPSGCSQSI